MTNYLLCGGTVIDGSGAPSRAADVLLRDGKIDRIEVNISADDATVIDTDGLLVCPGLIDLHVHVYRHMGVFSIDAANAGLKTGVTTMLDTGSAGAWTYGPFHHEVMPQAKEDVFALLNISALGVQGHPDYPPCLGDLLDARFAHVPWAVECIERHRDRLIGVKARLTAILADGKLENEEAGLTGVIEAARQTDTFAMVHHMASNLPLTKVLSALRPGDVYTHLYHPHEDNGFDSATGEPLPEMWEARERGVIFDAGHGVGAFSWRVAEPACSQHNFWPDVISTDLHHFNVNGPVFDLPTTLSKFLYLGMPLEKVIGAATSIPAGVMNMQDRIGLLQAGREADVTLLRLENTPTELTDVLGESRTADQRMRPVMSFKNGEMTKCAG